MTHFCNTLGPNGALLSVVVGVSAPRLEALVMAQQQVPLAVQTLLQLDTGATFTHIDQGIINGLGLQPTGTVTGNTPSSGANGVTMNVYDIALTVFGTQGNYGLGALPVLGADFSAQAIDGLIGRDILAEARFSYCGADNMFLLSF